MDHIFIITVDDAQIAAMDRIGRELTEYELYRVRKGVESGLELSWWDVLNIAIDELQYLNDTPNS